MTAPRARPQARRLPARRSARTDAPAAPAAPGSCRPISRPPMAGASTARCSMCPRAARGSSRGSRWRKARRSCCARAISATPRPACCGSALIPWRLSSCAAMRELLRRALERAGFAVATAATGREAVKLFGERQVDLAITDLMMPEMDGLTLIRELMRVQPSARIIVITGAESGHDTARALGAKVVLRKPVAPADLARIVQNVLAGEPAGERVTPPA